MSGELQEAFDLGWDGEALHSVSAAGVERYDAQRGRL